jgi:hypothetical protein
MSRGPKPLFCDHEHIAHGRVALRMSIEEPSGLFLETQERHMKRFPSCLPEATPIEARAPPHVRKRQIERFRARASCNQPATIVSFELQQAERARRTADKREGGRYEPKGSCRTDHRYRLGRPFSKLVERQWRRTPMQSVGSESSQTQGHL